MSLSTSKSKTQLAYNRLAKATHKPQNKNTPSQQTIDNNKSKSNKNNSTSNIYDSIMGQIQPQQQNYIKSLITKTQKQITKQQRQSFKQDKQSSKVQKEVKKSSANSQKSIKQTQQKNDKTSSTKLHQRTSSQASITLNQNSSCASLVNNSQTTSKYVKTQQQNIFNEIPSQNQTTENQQNNIKNQGVNKKSETNLKAQVQIKPSNNKQQKIKTKTNPIIQALNNSSSSFAKKLQVFQLQYPTEQRQQRSTHKKVPSKLAAGQYLSCQTSPKNNSKNTYANQIIVTTKQAHYQKFNYQKMQETISPIPSSKDYHIKTSNKKNQNNDLVGANFIQCLDEYLQALTINTSEMDQYPKKSKKGAMKRSNSTKIQQFSTSKGHPFTLGRQEQQQETVVLQNGHYSKMNYLPQKDQFSTKLLSFSQQQKLIKCLQKQNLKNQEMKNYIQYLNKELNKYKKKNDKMKQNQYHMIQALKEVNQKLSEQKHKRRQLQGVLKQFQNKIRGISRGKQKLLKSIQDQQRAQRKTIYGTSSLGNSIHFHNNKNQKNHIVKKHSKKPSNNRYSSMMINPNTQQYQQNILHRYENYEMDEQDSNNNDELFYKNKTQKFSKIISNFQLQNQQSYESDYQDMMRIHNVKNRNNESKMNRQSIKINYKNREPQSCKNSYLNNSILMNNEQMNKKQKTKNRIKSRPMTPKLIQELFKATSKSNNNKQNKKYHYVENEHSRLQLDDDSQNQINNEYGGLPYKDVQQRFMDQQTNELMDNNSSQQFGQQFEQRQMSQNEVTQDQQYDDDQIGYYSVNRQHLKEVINPSHQYIQRMR